MKRITNGMTCGRGAGYESETHYRDCKIKFLNIDNIHDMRSSLNSLLDLCQYIQDPKADGGSSRPTGWLSGLAYTKWLDHSRLVRSVIVTMVG